MRGAPWERRVCQAVAERGWEASAWEQLNLDGATRCYASLERAGRTISVEAGSWQELLDRALAATANPPPGLLAADPEPIQVKAIKTCTRCNMRAPWCTCGHRLYK